MDCCSTNGSKLASHLLSSKAKCERGVDEKGEGNFLGSRFPKLNLAAGIAHHPDTIQITQYFADGLKTNPSVDQECALHIRISLPVLLPQDGNEVHNCLFD